MESKGKFWAYIKEHKEVVKYAELFSAFILMEMLNKISHNSAQFQMIDFRLLYVVIMSSVYGMDMGIVSAILAGISVGIAYLTAGTDKLTMFYDPTNWLPFIAYFTAGGVCGHFRSKGADKVKLAQLENKLLKDKFLNLKKLYGVALENQKVYKKQIIGSSNSLGKVFEITQKLDVLEPNELLENAVQVMEEMLNNETIAIYAVGADKEFGKLKACSKQLEQNLPERIHLARYDRAMPIVEKGDIWINKELRDNYPMYLKKIRGAEGKELLVMVLRSAYEQQGMYYTNWINILCGLIENAFLRAMEYQKLCENNKR